MGFQREIMRAQLLQSQLTPQNWLLYEATLGPLMFPDGEDGEAGEVVPDVKAAAGLGWFCWC